MGLDTTHNCWHGPYSKFKRFRDAVAVAARDYYGYEPDFEVHPARAYQGWWDEEHEASNVLDVFFVHSYCDGYIFWQDQKPLADKLLPLVPLLGTEGGYNDWGKLLLQFILGLNKAYEDGEIIEFR